MKKILSRGFLNKLKNKTGVDRLQKREKNVLLCGLIFVTGFLVFQLIIMPYVQQRSKLADSLRQKESALVDIQLLRQDYLEAKSRQGDIEQRLASRAGGFSLFSFLEEQAANAQVKERVTYMKPSSNEIEDGFAESIVEMKMEKVSLEQLVDFLIKIESDENVVLVQRISIQESSREEGLLDTVVRIKTYQVSNS